MLTLLSSVERMFEGFSFGTFAGKVAITIGSLIAAFYSPITPLIVACFVFTIVDMFYGIKVAKKQRSKITSEKNWKGTITKLLDEFTIISLARLLEYAVLQQSEPFILTGGSTLILCLTELWSILENLNTINPKGPWKVLGAFLKKKGEEYSGININLNYDDDSNDHTMVTSES